MQSPTGDDYSQKVASLIRRGEQDLLTSLDQLHASELALTGGGEVAATLRRCLQGLPSPYPAWAYLGYYRLGIWLLGGATDQSSRMAQWAVDVCAAMAQYPIEPNLIRFGDPEQASPAIWDAVLSLFREGGDFAEDLEAPESDDLNHWRQISVAARSWIAAIDPQLHGLMRQLQSLIIAARPGPLARKQGQSFGGATCFFLRGATIVNASWPISRASMVELLVHEYAHAELFVMAQEQPLCLNRDDERHRVLIRNDPRPMNGILHSLYVVSRVAETLSKQTSQQGSARPIKPLDPDEVNKILQQQLEFGASSLRTIEQHATLTPLGQMVVTSAKSRLEAAAIAE